MRRKKFKQSTPAQARDPVRATVEDFFAQKFLTIHRVLANKKKPVTDAAKRVGIDCLGWTGNVEFIARHFDVIEWWALHGKEQYPLIYPVAMCMLSLPDSNGHQERTFSAASWMDGQLNSMQQEVTFQMKVLIYKNEAFLGRVGDRMGSVYLEEAEKRTRELLKKHISSKSEEEIEKDTEALMDLYKISGVEE